MLRHYVLAITAATLLAACSPSEEKTPPPKQPETAAPAPQTPAQSEIMLIRDGIGVGNIELGMSPADVESRLGKPDQVNKAGADIKFMGFREPENFGVYFGDDGRVRMLIVSVKKGVCTSYDACLYREGDLAKLKSHHGNALLRFTDRDGSVTYRLLTKQGDRQILTEYTPVEERNGIVQVAILYWTGKIDTSSFD